MSWHVQWVDVRCACSLCWSWWTYSPSLFNLSFHIIILSYWHKGLAICIQFVFSSTHFLIIFWNALSLWFYCSKNFKLFGFPIFRIWACLIKAIPETVHVLKFDICVFLNYYLCLIIVIKPCSSLLDMNRSMVCWIKSECPYISSWFSSVAESVKLKFYLRCAWHHLRFDI
jgi:hypothetical protein